MSTDLYRVSKSWAVKFTPKGQEKPEVVPFETIEQAATFLEEEVGISEKEVDTAIIDLATQHTTRAHFGNGITERGILFIGSDCEQLEGFIGIA